ncbi:MAG: alpha-2-macroglobulin family protein [Vicinamibacteria bacterium]
MRGRRRLVAMALVLAMPHTGGGSVVRRPSPPGKVTEAKGLTLRLGEAAADAPAATSASPAAVGEPLSAADVQRVLARLPELPPGPGEEKDFALREKSLPPPRTGTTVKDAFPPPPADAVPPADDAAGPLTVVRRMPEGEIPQAPQLSVTFSQPMVAVTAHGDLAASAMPVRLDPQPPGQWRWVGTKTLLFEPATRFPMATEFRVEVPAGTRSATGGTLAAAVRWTFGTPAPVLGGRHPVDRPTRRQPLLFAGFDQRVDPAAVLRTVKVTGASSLRLATAAEVAQDDEVRALSAQAGEGRSVVFVPEAPLPADTAITVTVGPGTPSAEGPRTTAQAQSWSFRTFGALKVVEHRCGWNGQCPPGTPWQIRFSNPIDAAAFRRDMVRVSPEVPGLKVDPGGQWINVRVASKGRTTYRLTLDAALPDEFGQTLGAAQTLTFTVGSAEPSLWGKTGLVVLDPAAGPRLSVYSTNHAALKVRAYAVAPSDWPAFQQYMQSFWRDRGGSTPPGKLSLSETVKVQGVPDEVTETRVDLAKALPRGLGHAIVLVEPVQPPPGPRQAPPVVAWVQATQIGLDAFDDGERLLAWATSLRDGAPLADVQLTIDPGAAVARTGADGVATVAIPGTTSSPLVARLGDDVAFLPQTTGWYGGDSGWRRAPYAPGFAWYVVDDRQMYRPGEDVKVKGWIRAAGPGPAGDVEPLPASARSVDFVLLDSQGNELSKGTRPLSRFGGFDLTLSLPKTVNLGPTSVTLTAAGATHTHTFQVQEFRRPEFEVKAEASEGPHLVGGRADVDVSAAYYAGGALPDAETAWAVSQTPATYTPPNRQDFTFGTWVPWWESSFEPSEPARVDTYAARTDATGHHRLRIEFLDVDPPRPTSVKAEATVTDVNRQGWTASSTLLVHPSTLYVGLKSERLFVQRGQALKIDAIVTDIDGAAVAGRPFTVRAERLDWDQVDGVWQEVPAAGEDCAVTSGTAAVRCSFVAKEGGVWRVTATVVDAQQRRNQSQLRLWVPGGKTPPSRSVDQEKVTLVPDKKEYRAGETAEVLVLAPFTPAEGILTLRRAGLLRHERFTMKESSHTLRVPIEEAWTPGLALQVDLVGSAARTRDDGEIDPKLAPRPAFAVGSIDLSVPPYARTLALSVTPRERELAPGGETVLDLQVKDASGRAASGADVAVVVVDEAVLALTGYRLPDPLSIIYAKRPPFVTDHHSRSSVALARPEEAPVAQGLALAGAAPPPAPKGVPARRALAKGGRQEEAEGALGFSFDSAVMVAAEPEPISVRTDFSALALFVASVETDANGRAQVPVKLPDSLTRYRVMAVAADATNRFGQGESTVVGRLPLMVRPSAPRFLNFGDRFELPVVVQNQTDAAMTVDVALRARNADVVDAGKRVTVPARDRVEVRFRSAARRPGTARFQVGAVAGRLADAASFALPVWTPATTEAFATYGQIDQGAVRQPVAAPKDVVREFGGLEVTTSSTALQALTDAVLYLVAYPFECAEQLSSRVLAVAALKDVLGAFQAEGLPAPSEMTAAVGRDLARLQSMQNDDGGFGFWRRGDESWPYVSIHVAHALERAQAKGFTAPAGMRERSLSYLKNIDQHLKKDWSPETRRALQSYALYVRFRMGDRDAARARAVIRDAGGVEKMPLEPLGWLLPVLSGDAGSQAEVTAIRRHVANRATETAATATFATDYGEQGAYVLLHSNRRTDAVLLEALIADQPKSDLVPKIVEGLLGHRRKGRWENTQENAFVLLALDRYFATYEKVTPDFVARTWLGDGLAGEHAFRGRTTERHHVDIPMAALGAPGATTDLVVGKDGPGRLYYRIGMQYAPSSLVLAPADHGFTVERTYVGLDDPKDVRRDADGTWRIKAGARVRVRVTMAAESRRYHVALVDPLPAGLEAMNPALAVTGTLPTEDQTVDVIGAPGIGGPGRPGHWWWWRRVWFDHQNLRDERVEAFASLLWEGVYTYAYVARATTPGTFVVPPAKAEEMYHPETFGRSGSDRVVVE